MNSWSMLDVRRALELRRQGHSHREIAALLGRPLAHVQRQLWRYGPPPIPRPPGLTPARAASLRQSAANGACLSAASREIDAPASTVLLWLARLGLSLPNGRRAPPLSEDGRGRMGEPSSLRNREACESLGWPEVVVPAQARILDALHRLGPLDHACLALALGWTLCVGRRGGLYCRRLARHLRALTLSFGGPEHADRPRKRRSGRYHDGPRRYVEVIPGRPRRYRLADWLRARKEDGGS